MPEVPSRGIDEGLEQPEAGRRPAAGFRAHPVPRARLSPLWMGGVFPHTAETLFLSLSILPCSSLCTMCYLSGKIKDRAVDLQDDSDFFSSQGSINSLDDEIVRKECLSALERSGIPLSQAPPAWPSNSSSAPGALPAHMGTDDSSTTDMLVRRRLF